jgi:hypothetical protein
MNKKNTQAVNSAKAYKPASTAYFTIIPAQKRETMDWQSHYYRQKALEFNNSASFEASPKAEVVKTTKKEVSTVVSRISKVRGNNPRVPLNAMQSKYVMVGGVPHKMVNGKLVALTAQAK